MEALECSFSKNKDDADPCKYAADYIVIGVGTTGPQIIRALADDNQSVVAFERGFNHTGDPLVEGGLEIIFPPTGNATVLTYDARYSVTKLIPDELNARRLNQIILAEEFTTGVGGGGSSAHNYLLAVRGTPGFWDRVGQETGRPDLWSYFPNLERIKSVETYTGLSQKPQERGNRGKIFVTQLGGDILASPQAPIAQGLTSVTGAPILLDYNVSGTDVVISSNQFTIFPPAGGRSYSINAYLPPSIMKFNGDSVNVAKHPFKVFFETNVVRILFEGRRAIGVIYKQKNGEQRIALARKKVILCAGCPWSAQILQLSGIGNENLLRNLKIQTILNNPNVGRNLQTQYGVTVAITGLLPGSGFTAFTGGSSYFPDQGRRLQWVVAPFSGLSPALLALLTPQGPFFGATIWNMKPRSFGSAFIVENSPFILPNILYNLYSDGDQNDPLSDLSASIAAYKIGRDWAHAIGQTMIWPPESHFIPGDDSRLALDALSQVKDATTSHFVNTVAAGPSPSDSVVNGKLKVHGIKDLLVIDNSIFKTIPDANTVIPAYIVGAVGAKILRSKIPQNK